MSADAQAVSTLLGHVSPDNDELITLWTAALRRAGGLYQTLDDEALRVTARGTVRMLRGLLDNGRMQPDDARRFVDPPQYRNQPLDEFVLASMLVDRTLRDYLHAHAPDLRTAHAATARIDPLMAAGMMQVVRLRQRRMNAGQLLADLGRLFADVRRTRALFNAVADRVARDTGADLCIVCGVDSAQVEVLGTSLPPNTIGLPADLSMARDRASWLDTLTDAPQYELVLQPSGEGLVARLHRAGWRRAQVRPLATHGRLVGAVLLVQRSPDPMGDGFGDVLQTVHPLLAAQLSLTRQRADLNQAAAAIDELFDASPNMMCVLDRLGRIQRTNRRFREEIGVPGDLVGMPLSWLVHPAWVERFEALWNRIVREGQVNQERVDLITAASARLPLALEAHWLEDDSIVHRQCMVALWNVSAHVEREARSRQRIDDLSQFAHSVAHDLKAPLRTIAGFTALLVEELPADTSEELHAYAARIEGAAERAGDLVSGLLHFAHSADMGAGASEVVALSDLVEDVRVKLAGDLGAAGGQLVVVEDATPLLGRPVPLATMLGNLVANALRYSDGAAPRIEIGVRSDGVGWADLYVRDFGVGIEAALHEEIFELFRRGPTDRPGSGIGLAVVRRIARAHGGDVSVESALGRGSTFAVRLPTP